MTGALALTGAVAYGIANTPALLNLFFQMDVMTGGAHPTMLGYVVLFAPLALVLLLSFRIQQMSQAAAQLTFWVYAAMVGASLASIFLLYSLPSIALTFFVTAATFGSMSLYGYTTSRDLTGMGSFLMMGVFGLFIAMIANMFFQSAAMSFVVSVLGVVIFTGLTAWDTQKIKQVYYAVGGDTAVAGKAAIMGALSLYLDFLNIFLFLLRFMGNRR
jgi:FtsH-binding integral membrane protein